MSCRGDQLNPCGCCEGLTHLTPVELLNRPGLSTMTYRVGTHARFKESMLAGISTSRVLDALTTRRDDDLGIALLDAWAVVLDVLTFYQERIANEGFLRTAVERLSLLELARLIGYELAPGVSASTYLSFTLDDKEGSPEEVTLAAGTRAQSIPGQDELPQTFETTDDLLARPEWSVLLPRRTHPQLFTHETRVFHIEGTTSGLEPGDSLLLIAAPVEGETEEHLVPLSVAAVETDAEENQTRLVLEVGAREVSTYAPGSATLGTFAYAAEPFTGTSVGSLVLEQAWSTGELGALTGILGWPTSDLGRHLLAVRASTPVAVGEAATGLYAMRTEASVFGHNAPRWATLPTEWTASDGPFSNDWDGEADGSSVIPAINESSKGVDHTPTNAVYLDRVYDDVVEGSLVVVEGQDAEQVFKVLTVREESVADFALSAKVTRLTLQEIADAGPSDLSTLDDFTFRKTTLKTQSEALTLVELPIEDPVEEDLVELEEVELRLESGRHVIVEGERCDLAGVTDSEVAVIKEILQVGGYTQLIFDVPLEHSYVRETVKIYANVAHATHGESHKEVLGSGNAATAFQSFVLKQSPLTYVSAPVSGGGESSLEVRVNGVRWHESPDFYRLGPEDRTYVLRRDDEGNTSVRFGDGVHGARLPTGIENVIGSYRSGTGTAGHVDKGRITLLSSPPLGVREVTNPLAASGGEDPEERDDARRNAPTTVRTLGRVVSLTDFEDYARTFSGIAKARADRIWDGARRLILVTVSGADGDEVSADLLGALRSDMDSARDPLQPMALESYGPLFFNVRARIEVHPDYLIEEVVANVEEALREAFSFAARDFVRGAHKSEVIEITHSVEGVVAVAVDALELVPEPESGPISGPSLEARPARLGTDADGAPALLGAELLTLSPGPIDLEGTQ